MGNAFCERMEAEDDLPKAEGASIPFGEQDSVTRANVEFSELDSMIGNDNVTVLKKNWPYVGQTQSMSNYRRRDFAELLQP